MKKFFVLLSLIAIVGLGGLFISCGKKNSSADVHKKFNSDSDMFAFATVSTANLFNTSSNMPVEKAVEDEEVKPEVKPNQDIDMDKVNEYLQLMENLLADDGPIVVKNGESDRVDYKFMTVYGVKNLAGEKSTFTIYYNQTLDGEDATEPLDDDDKDDEQEEEYILEGIAIVDGIEYKLHGEKELEQGEYELEIVITFDELNQVVLKEEIEKDETEYEYKVIKDGKKFLEVEFEAEEVDQETEIEIVTSERGFKESYKFEKEVENGKHIIVIKYKGNGNKLTIKATGILNEETGVIEYTYKVKETNKEYHYDKNHNDTENKGTLQ